MTTQLRRRSFLTGTSLAVPAACTFFLGASTSRVAGATADDVPASFPSQHADLVRETVGAAHGDFKRLQELVETNPPLARANWDWGFGDWESALGAASHMGRKDIAEYLILNGARPNLFTAAMLGQLPVVRAYLETSPGIQRILGPHGITLLSHARAGGEPAQAVVEYLESVGGADQGPEGVPLDEESRRKYFGKYSFAPGEDGTLTVEQGRFGITLARGAGLGRPILFRGNHTFSPTVAPHIAIRFRVEGGIAVEIRIDSSDVKLIAARIG